MEKLLEWLKAERGRQKFLAENLGIHSHAISQWTRVPAEIMGKISWITGIPMEQLRPDIFQDAGRIPRSLPQTSVSNEK